MRDSITSSPDHPLPPEPTDGVLDQYLAAQLPEAESQQVTKYVEQRPEWRRFLGHIRHWLTEPDIPQAPDEREAFSRFLRILSVWSREPAHLAGQTSPEHSGRKLGTGQQTFRIVRQKEGVFSGRTLRRSVWYGAAGAVVAAFLLAVGWRAVAWRLGRNVPPKILAYTTANGERATITLTDGSTVILNVASRLEVPADYAAGDHAVRLVGEALFTVAHQDGAPFTVIAGPTVTRVLGTSFIVRRYGSDTVTTVAVRDGKVAVGATVIPAVRFFEVGRSGVGRMRQADESQFGFARGVLALRSMSLAEAVPELDRWYDADIRLSDASLATRLVKGYVTAGSLADLSELLSMAFNVRVVRDGRVLTLYAR